MIITCFKILIKNIIVTIKTVSMLKSFFFKLFSLFKMFSQLKIK